MFRYWELLAVLPIIPSKFFWKKAWLLYLWWEELEEAWSVL